MSPGFIMLFGLLAILGGVKSTRGLDPMEFLRRYSLDRYLQIQAMVLGGVVLLFAGAALLAGGAP